MSEQLKQEVDTAEIDRLETETDVDSKTIGQDETELPESKLEDESGNEVKAEDTVYLGKASLAEILTGMADPTEEEIRAAEIENAKPVKQKAKEKLEELRRKGFLPKTRSKRISGKPITPYERTRAQVAATGNRWAMENFYATHS